MYVLHETLGLSEEKMIVPMDEKRGKLLLAEILNGGNFGQPLHQVWAFYTTRNGKEIFPEDMEKYALRAILSCRSFK